MNSQKYYYGFELWGEENTTTGEPNLKTRKMSIAGSLEKFSLRKNRDVWVSKEKSKTRIACSKEELRKWHQGMSQKEFNDHLDMILAD